MTNRERDEATAGYEAIYADAARGARNIPWDRHAPHPLLVQWFDHAATGREGKRAVVVGAGTGDDAAFVAARGLETIAFDIAPSAVAAARERHPDTAAGFVEADLFELPEAWSGGFDLVVEIQTIQALPRSLREEVVHQVARLVAPGGTVVAIAAAADAPREDGPPWPLTRDEIDGFERAGLSPVAVDRIASNGIGPFTSHWLAEFTRASNG